MHPPHERLLAVFCQTHRPKLKLFPSPFEGPPVHSSRTPLSPRLPHYLWFASSDVPLVRSRFLPQHKLQWG